MPVCMHIYICIYISFYTGWWLTIFASYHISLSTQDRFGWHLLPVCWRCLNSSPPLLLLTTWDKGYRYFGAIGREIEIHNPEILRIFLSLKIFEGKWDWLSFFLIIIKFFFWRTVRLKFRQFKFLYRPFVCLGHESWGHRGQIQDRKKQIQQENQCVISSVGIVTLWHLEYQINKAMINTILLFLDV